jgi:hypothetical protein
VTALTSVYAPPELAPGPPVRGPLAGGQSRQDVISDTFARAVEHGDAHVIKFADTAVEVYARTGNPDAIAAARLAAELIQR